MRDYTLLLIKAGCLDEARERGLHLGGPGTAASEARVAIAAAFAKAGRFADAREVLQVMQQCDDDRAQEMLEK